MTASEQRVVLVKPDDYLVFGNVGEVPPDAIRACADAMTRDLGIKGVAFFVGDIDITKVPDDD